MNSDIHVGLTAVIVASVDGTPHILSTRPPEGKQRTGLPSGPFHPVDHRTFELGLREWVNEQTGFELGYVEQLYTFGDRGRDLPEARLDDALSNARVISIGYLGLTPEATEIGAFEANWRDWYRFFPWEDHRSGPPELISGIIMPALVSWAQKAGNDADIQARHTRAALAFGSAGHPWIEERVLERYELLYEAGLVAEYARDRHIDMADAPPLPGEAMSSDHRRILATAMGRLRGKSKYRPVLFELMPEAFTLSALQRASEGLLGLTLHTQNFRRALEKTQLVEGLGSFETGTGGRPAERFRFRREVLNERITMGVQAPQRRT